MLLKHTPFPVHKRLKRKPSPRCTTLHHVALDCSDFERPLAARIERPQTGPCSLGLRVLSLLEGLWVKLTLGTIAKKMWRSRLGCGLAHRLGAHFKQAARGRHNPQAKTPAPRENAMNHTQAGASAEPEINGGNLCIDEIFELQARKTPDAIALTCGNEHLSYQQLNERANQLANYLVKSGAGPEIPVVLYLERSLNMVVAILGVLKAGGTYVPVDLAYPKERLAFMLEDSQAPLLLTQQNLRAALPANRAKVVCLDSDREKIGLESSSTPVTETTTSNAAYIIYTSGSTGKPKGVVVTHHNVVRLLKQTAHWYAFNERDVWPLFHSYAFDVSVWELWGSLFHGGRLVIVPYLVSRSPSDFYELIAREKVTVLNQTPSAFRQFIWAEESAETKRELCLRYVICAGEALELQSLKPWFARHGDEKTKVINMYGITETTVHSTYRWIRKADVEANLGSVIGVPIPDLTLHLVDENLQPVPPGTPGEICVGGGGVARGYLNRPELNAKRFVPDPFSSVPEAKLYRSGDLAQYNSNGELEYLGRMDHQVKIRGFRVELGEIESALNRHPAIRESVVVAQDSDRGDKRLVAYFVPVTTAPNVSEVREHLLRSIPDYMVPALFVPLKTLPLTTNGKVDRRALPSPEGTRPELREAFVPASNAREQVLAEIWREVLGVQKVGIHDNYFELGGDSIRSIAILSKARKRGWSISLEQMFQHPTIAQLAACAQRVSETAGGGSKPFSLVSAQDQGKFPTDVEDAYPVAKLQMGMFYSNELHPESAMYHDVFSYEIRAPFDEGKLGQTIAVLAERHPLLRTSFQLAGYSEPLQLVHRRVKISFSIEDLRGLSGAEQEQRLRDWVEKEKRRPFNRALEPSFRFHAQRREDECFQFIISFHHSCLDGWSLALIITEIFQQYSALLKGTENAITAPRATYRDFVAKEREAITSENQRRFWKEKLQGSINHLLPRWPASHCSGGTEQVRGPEIQLEPEVLAGLRKLAQSASVPLKTVLLAAHQRVLALMLGQNDITTGLISNGRPEETDGENLVGLFLNSVPLRMELSGGTWQELVKQTFAAEQEVMPFRRFPLAEIQKLHGGRQVLETAFDFVHFHVLNSLNALEAFGFKEGHYFEANNLTSYTTFMLDAGATQLELHIDYDPNLICRKQIEQMSNYYVRALRAMATQPETRYEEALLLSEDEHKQMLVAWNGTQETYPREHGIETLFEQQALENPEAIALVCQGQRLSYQELNRRADEKAAELCSLGVGPEVLVGLYTTRSVEMMVGLLAVLKAGGAYVPLDPVYPQERLAFMLEDARVPILLTQKELRSALPPTSARVICLDEPSGGGSERQRSTAGADNLAYVIYTSGSTGKPKGVQIQRRSVMNLLTSIARKTGFSARDNLVAVTTLSFDIAGLELFLPLISGATLTLASREQASDGVQLGSLIESSGATVLQGTPSTWRLLIEAGWGGNTNLRAFCGGEALTRELANEVSTRSRELWNFYGPTETTIWSTCSKVEPGDPISIGRPLANTQLYIVDQQLRPVPIGTAGELLIGGDGLARGYLNQAELSAAKFVSAPFTATPRARLYRTGDLARYRPDGTVEWLGRLDHQVKVRGFRIELGEIESIIRQHHGIAEALVTTADDNFGEKRLVGYLTSRNGPPSVPELREFLRTKLPPYMVPAQFVVLEKFPLTPNGKVDRNKLPAPENQVEPSVPYVAPRNEREAGIARVWQEVLSLKQVGIDENFFDVGGDSLSATRMFARINRAFSQDITLRNVFEQPTIRALAELLSNGKPASPSKATIPRQPRAFEVV